MTPYLLPNNADTLVIPRIYISNSINQISFEVYLFTRWFLFGQFKYYGDFERIYTLNGKGVNDGVDGWDRLEILKLNF